MPKSATVLPIHCDTAYVALPLLAALAAAIGNSRCICLKRGAFRWQEPAVLWTANVGESGTAKSPAIKAALLFIERRERQAIREAERRQAEYANEMLRYEVELTAWKRSGCKQGEPEPQKPAQPVCRRFCVSDTTVVTATKIRNTPAKRELCQRRQRNKAETAGARPMTQTR